MIGATDIKISVLVRKKFGDQAVRALHRSLIESGESGEKDRE
jgi:aspartokinase